MFIFYRPLSHHCTSSTASFLPCEKCHELEICTQKIYIYNEFEQFSDTQMNSVDCSRAQYRDRKKAECNTKTLKKSDSLESCNNRISWNILMKLMFLLFCNVLERTRRFCWVGRKSENSKSQCSMMTGIRETREKRKLQQQKNLFCSFVHRVKQTSRDHHE